MARMMRIFLLVFLFPEFTTSQQEITAQPISEPTSSPIVQITAPPSVKLTVVPTTKPTARPSAKPSTQPTKKPSTLPTRKPSALPTRKPSAKPSAKPSRRPSAKPTRRPTRKPSARPTRKPSRRPSSKPTRRPSSIPTRTPSRHPTSSPTAAPSFQLAQFTIQTFIQFDKCNPLDAFAQTIWRNVTADTIRAQLFNTLNNDAKSLQVFIGILSQGSTKARRLQQTSPLNITFNTFINIRSITNYTQYSMESYVLKAFDSLDKKTTYIFRLQQQSSAFSSINKMTITIRDYIDTPPPTMKPNMPPNKENSTVIITASSVGGILSFFACACLFRMRRRKKKRELSIIAQRLAEPPREPTLIQVLPTDEDVSTLSDGHVAPGGINIFGIIDGNDHTDGSSMLSSDYDYNMAYGGAGDIQSISTAGGMKSAIVSKPLYYPKVAQGPYDVSRQSSISSKNSDPSVSMKETLTLYSDDNSFERQYNQPDDRIEVMAPAGKLGIVIDTPNGGIPMVHAIKESSILIDQVKVGDRLIMVDGIDTTSMSAIKVSRLISTRSDNPRRVLVFLRYRTED